MPQPPSPTSRASARPARAAVSLAAALLAGSLAAGCGGGVYVDECSPSSAPAEATLEGGPIAATWWTGDDPVVGTLTLDVSDEGCGLTVETDAPWVAASYDEHARTVRVSVVPDRVTSGTLRAHVLVVGPDPRTGELASIASAEVEVKALTAGPADARRHALVFGLDGFRPDAIAAADTPNLDRLFSHGSSTLKASTQLTGDTFSGPGWASILMGVEVAKHGIVDNDSNALLAPHPDYPTMLQRAHDAGLDVRAIASWAPLLFLVETDIAERTPAANEAAVAPDAVLALQEHSTDLLFLHFDALDHAGHATGFGPSNPDYIAALEATDTRIGTVLDAVYARPDVANERWMFVVVTDHAGEGTIHGPREPIFRTIPLAFSGPGVPDVDIDGASQMDVYPTVLDFLGVSPSPDWGLDGKVDVTVP